MGIQPWLGIHIRVGRGVPELDLIFVAYFSRRECARVVHEGFY